MDSAFAIVLRSETSNYVIARPCAPAASSIQCNRTDEKGAPRPRLLLQPPPRGTRNSLARRSLGGSAVQDCVRVRKSA